MTGIKKEGGGWDDDSDDDDGSFGVGGGGSDDEFAMDGAHPGNVDRRDSISSTGSALFPGGPLRTFAAPDDPLADPSPFSHNHPEQDNGFPLHSSHHQPPMFFSSSDWQFDNPSSYQPTAFASAVSPGGSGGLDSHPAAEIDNPFLAMLPTVPDSASSTPQPLPMLGSSHDDGGLSSGEWSSVLQPRGQKS